MGILNCLHLLPLDIQHFSVLGKYYYRYAYIYIMMFFLWCGKMAPTFPCSSSVAAKTGYCFFCMGLFVQLPRLPRRFKSWSPAPGSDGMEKMLYAHVIHACVYIYMWLIVGIELRVLGNFLLLINDWNRFFVCILISQRLVLVVLNKVLHLDLNIFSNSAYVSP